MLFFAAIAVVDNIILQYCSRWLWLRLAPESLSLPNGFEASHLGFTFIYKLTAFRDCQPGKLID